MKRVRTRASQLDKSRRAVYLRRPMLKLMFHMVVLEPVAKTGATARVWNIQPTTQATS